MHLICLRNRRKNVPRCNVSVKKKKEKEKKKKKNEIPQERNHESILRVIKKKCLFTRKETFRRNFSVAFPSFILSIRDNIFGLGIFHQEHIQRGLVYFSFSFLFSFLLPSSSFIFYFSFVLGIRGISVASRAAS